MRHVVYLLNHLSMKVLIDHTPFEAWNRRKMHMAYLLVFCCIAHAKVTMPHLKKLDNRSQPHICTHNLLKHGNTTI